MIESNIFAETEAKARKAAAKKPETKTVRLPRKGAGEDNYELVGLNGKMWQIPCGKPVELPLPVYELVMRQQEARDALMDVQDNIPNEG